MPSTASIPEFSLSFAADPDQNYGYDDWTNASRPWKSVALGDNDTVLAQLKLGLADYYSDVSFSTNDSAIATVKVPSVENMHQLVKLTVSGVAKGQVTVKGAIEEASGLAVAADRLLLAIPRKPIPSVTVMSCSPDSRLRRVLLTVDGLQWLAGSLYQ